MAWSTGVLVLVDQVYVAGFIEAARKTKAAAPGCSTGRRSRRATCILGSSSNLGRVLCPAVPIVGYAGSRGRLAFSIHAHLHLTPRARGNPRSRDGSLPS